MTTDAATMRPAPVSLALTLVYASAVVGVLGAVVTLADGDALRQQALAAAGGDTAVADTAVAVGIAVGVATAVIGAALWVVFGILAGRGRGWARIVLAVLAGLTVVASLTSLGGPALLVVVAVLRLLLAAGILVLLFRPEANRWYAAHRAARQPAPAVGYPPAA